tara:strand:- start:2718 stop:3494 length:777 start_codon:yes stop_codon:yes gene_type:complete
MNFSRNVSGIVDELDLEKSYDKSIIKFRFLNEISFYEEKRDYTRKYYNAFRFIVTTGSILLPAILSMGQMDPAKLPANFDMVSYWTSWIISLMVTASNGFLQLFSLDKNYFSYSMVVEQLKTEGWQFFGLSGKYEDFESHQEAYKVFSKSIESIKRKQVEQEFSNGKGDNKKKKFDFHGEMKKFSQDQQRTIENVTDTVQTVAKVANTAQNVNKAIDQLKGETLENIEMDVIEEGVAEENKENKENKVDDGGEGKKEE